MQWERNESSERFQYIYLRCVNWPALQLLRLHKQITYAEVRQSRWRWRPTRDVAQRPSCHGMRMRSSGRLLSDIWRQLGTVILSLLVLILLLSSGWLCPRQVGRSQGIGENRNPRHAFAEGSVLIHLVASHLASRNQLGPSLRDCWRDQAEPRMIRWTRDKMLRDAENMSPGLAIWNIATWPRLLRNYVT